MSDLDPAKLHVRFAGDAQPHGPLAPRCYTLTHSDRTGDLFLTIGSSYDRNQISGWYTRLMRDEVLAEWVVTAEGPALDIHVHVSGGLVFGSAAWRDRILRTHMPQVIQALRQGDAALFAAQAQLDQAPAIVHFHSHRPGLDRVEPWGALGEYALQGHGVGPSARPAA